MSERLTILLSGMIAGVPHQGGATWSVLQYLLGLRDLGHDVYFIEPVAEDPDAVPLDRTASARYFNDVYRSFDLESCSALLRQGSRETVGLPYKRLLEASKQADVLINIAGMLTDPELLEPIPMRLYLDLDPAFTQLWHEVQGIDMRFSGHTDFATVGLAIGSEHCSVPAADRSWIPTLQPVVLDRWPIANRIERGALTTVANWRGYGSIDHDGVFYGQKAHSIRKFFDLPKRIAFPVEIALSIHPDERGDIEALNSNDWLIIDPSLVASTPECYQRFVQGSLAEIGFAKTGYVESKSGWFSDRSVCYLASGRPVIAQETGFGNFLPAGHGLHSFETIEDIQGAVATLTADYARESRAARAIAEDLFDSRKVLASLLDRIGNAA